MDDDDPDKVIPITHLHTVDAVDDEAPLPRDRARQVLNAWLSGLAPAALARLSHHDLTRLCDLIELQLKVEISAPAGIVTEIWPQLLPLGPEDSDFG